MGQVDCYSVNVREDMGGMTEFGDGLCQKLGVVTLPQLIYLPAGGKYYHKYRKSDRTMADLEEFAL